MTDQTEILVETTRYSVSLLPRGDSNFHSYALHVQRRRDGWGITDGAGWVESLTGHWTLDHYEALTFPTPEPALVLARKVAPNVTVNGITASEAYRRTQTAARQATGQADSTPFTCAYCGHTWAEHGEEVCGKASHRLSDGLLLTTICRCTKKAPASAAGRPDPTTADDPTPLRWGVGDVLHGDDGTVTVCLSGPDRKPYWLELDPERAQALRDDLTPPAGPGCVQCADTGACNGGPCAHPTAEHPMNRALGLGAAVIPDDITIEICEATNSGVPLPWPQFTEPDGELWWLTNETHDGDRVMLPAAGDMQPMLRRDVERFFGPLTPAGQPAAAPADEAHPPETVWRVEGYDADQWNPLTGPLKTRETAVLRRARIEARYPGMPTRRVREDTTWTVEDETR